MNWKYLLCTACGLASCTSSLAASTSTTPKPCSVILTKIQDHYRHLFTPEEVSKLQSSDSGNVVILGKKYASMAEISAIERLGATFPEKHFLLSGELPGYIDHLNLETVGNTPVFDGVIYNSGGYAESNVSIKSILIDNDSTNIRKAFSVHLKSARGKIRKLRSGALLKDLKIEPDGFEIGRARYLNLFGIAQHTERPSTIVVDFHSDSGGLDARFSSPYESIRSQNFDQKTVPYIFIDISVSGREDIQIGLSQMQNDLKNEHSYIQNYIFSSPTKVIELTKDKIIEHNIKVEN